MKLPRFRVTERQALHFIMIACAIGVASAFFVVFWRRHTAQPEISPGPLVRWISAHTFHEKHDWRPLMAEMDDPSLMSLPHPRAFSAAFWQRHATIETQPIQPSNSIAYLDAPPPQSLTPLLTPAPLPETVRLAAAKPETTFSQPAPVESVNGPGQSAIQLDSQLESFRLLRAPSLPVIVSETSLRPTVVRLAVAADGTIAHVVLERSCGNENADGIALEAARQLRFALPLSSHRNPLRWGSARFLWATKMP